jgi:hypothetical protein
VLSKYKYVGKTVWYLISAELLLNLVNSAFFLILNLYLRSLGLKDDVIAEYTSIRLIAVVLLSLPVGIYIRYHTIKPFFYAAGVGLPLLSVLFLYAVSHEYTFWAKTCVFLWGVAYTCIQVASVPFFTRNIPNRYHTEIFSLHFAVSSASAIISGLLIYGLQQLNSTYFTDLRILYCISGIGFFALFCIPFIKERKIPAEKLNPSFVLFKDYDWGKIGTALFPGLILAIGAGLTIPFFNLFFNSVFGFKSDEFSILTTISFVLVLVSSLIIPSLKRRYGYFISVILSQAIATLSLFVLASTEWYKGYGFALPVAITAYLVRQPLMNMAAPMTSEWVMNYVGEKNREMVSSLNAGMWSGSWFISAVLFGIFRKHELAYGQIFMITVVMYFIAVYLYHVFMRRDSKTITKNRT